MDFLLFDDVVVHVEDLGVHIDVIYDPIYLLDIVFGHILQMLPHYTKIQPFFPQNKHDHSEGQFRSIIKKDDVRVEIYLIKLQEYFLDQFIVIILFILRFFLVGVNVINLIDLLVDGLDRLD